MADQPNVVYFFVDNLGYGESSSLLSGESTFSRNYRAVPFPLKLDRNSNSASISNRMPNIMKRVSTFFLVRTRGRAKPF